ncbi:hypothetical protein GJ496_004967 [Pomphorhynchus laevis]|nr:hypothetical protein GJ496_004967 [Pomphorhynchus laevis]
MSDESWPCRFEHCEARQSVQGRDISVFFPEANINYDDCDIWGSAIGTEMLMKNTISEQIDCYARLVQRLGIIRDVDLPRSVCGWIEYQLRSLQIVIAVDFSARQTKQDLSEDFRTILTSHIDLGDISISDIIFISNVGDMLRQNQKHICGSIAYAKKIPFEERIGTATLCLNENVQRT